MVAIAILEIARDGIVIPILVMEDTLKTYALRRRNARNVVVMISILTSFHSLARSLLKEKLPKVQQEEQEVENKS